jgi:AraC-like DNA-binding protein
MAHLRWIRHQHAVFTPAPGISPAVLTASSYECRGFRTDGPVRLCYADWVADIPALPGLRVRVGDDSSPWIERPVGRMHLYAPRTPFWEDGQRLPRGHMSGIYVIVRDATGLLARITGERGFAMVDDAAGLLRRALTGAFAAPGHPTFWRCQAAWAEAMEELSNAIPVSGCLHRVGGAPEGKRLVDRVEAEILRHLDRPLALAGLAHRLGISVSSLCHRFRREAGEPVMMRWRRLRVERAVALLARGHRLSEIAEMCGFSDRFHLSRTIRQLTGHPPAEWRRIQATA